MSRSKDGPISVPLSLSSMAHMSIPLDKGVLDGLGQMVQHTLLACVNYARASFRGEFTFRDLYTTDWISRQRRRRRSILTPELSEQGFQHVYSKECYICLTTNNPGSIRPKEEDEEDDDEDDDEEEDNNDDDDWLQHEQVLGCVTLWFASDASLTAEELEDDDDDDDDDYYNNNNDDDNMKDDDDDDDDMPTTVLVRVVVVYRSQPPTGNREAVEAEEISMLSFGGSVDDDVKYGALAALYDQHGCYVTEITSVRGKTYRFHLVDSTLADGRVPRSQFTDAPPKSLSVTVTENNNNNNNNNNNMTRMEMRLSGGVRNEENGLPGMNFYTKRLSRDFLLWQRPVSATALPCRQTLLLEPRMAGRVYVHGRYLTTWGQDPRVGNHAPALFGLDLHSVPVWHRRIVDYEHLKKEYARAWHEILIDARLMPLNLAGMLLFRLMYGKDDDHDEYDDEDDDEEEEESKKVLWDTSVDTLESQTIGSARYDPVGVAAKALGTKFAQEFGRHAFPVVASEVPIVKDKLGHRTPVVVPPRVIAVLRRGGYFDWKRTMEEIWFADHVRPSQTPQEIRLVEDAVQYLQQALDDDYLFLAGHDEILPSHVVWVRFLDTTSGGRIEDVDPVKHRNLCRYHEAMKQFYVNDALLHDPNAIHLGFVLAQAHPDGNVQDKYVQRHLH